MEWTTHDAATSTTPAGRNSSTNSLQLADLFSLDEPIADENRNKTHTEKTK
jgi:hypothetical protein